MTIETSLIQTQLLEAQSNSLNPEHTLILSSTADNGDVKNAHDLEEPKDNPVYNVLKKYFPQLAQKYLQVLLNKITSEEEIKTIQAAALENYTKYISRESEIEIALKKNSSPFVNQYFQSKVIKERIFLGEQSVREVLVDAELHEKYINDFSSNNDNERAGLVPAVQAAALQGISRSIIREYFDPISNEEPIPNSTLQQTAALRSFYSIEQYSTLRSYFSKKHVELFFKLKIAFCELENARTDHHHPLDRIIKAAELCSSSFLYYFDQWLNLLSRYDSSEIEVITICESVNLRSSDAEKLIKAGIDKKIMLEAQELEIFYHPEMSVDGFIKLIQKGVTCQTINAAANTKSRVLSEQQCTLQYDLLDWIEWLHLDKKFSEEVVIACGSINLTSSDITLLLESDIDRKEIIEAVHTGLIRIWPMKDYIALAKRVSSSALLQKFKDLHLFNCGEILNLLDNGTPLEAIIKFGSEIFNSEKGRIIKHFSLTDSEKLFHSANNVCALMDLKVPTQTILELETCSLLHISPQVLHQLLQGQLSPKQIQMLMPELDFVVECLRIDIPVKVIAETIMLQPIKRSCFNEFLPTILKNGITVEFINSIPNQDLQYLYKVSNLFKLTLEGNISLQLITRYLEISQNTTPPIPNEEVIELLKKALSPEEIHALRGRRVHLALLLDKEIGLSKEQIFAIDFENKEVNDLLMQTVSSYGLSDTSVSLANKFIKIIKFAKENFNKDDFGFYLTHVFPKLELYHVEALVTLGLKLSNDQLLDPNFTDQVFCVIQKTQCTYDQAMQLHGTQLTALIKWGVPEKDISKKPQTVTFNQVNPSHWEWTAQHTNALSLGFYYSEIEGKTADQLLLDMKKPARQLMEERRFAKSLDSKGVSESKRLGEMAAQDSSARNPVPILMSPKAQSAATGSCALPLNIGNQLGSKVDVGNQTLVQAITENIASGRKA